MQASLIRPGLLVSLKTSLSGGVQYAQTVLDPDHAEGKARVAEWQTRRTIQDADEHAKATVARSKIRTLVRAACIDTAFGLLCPEPNEGKLAEAIKQGQEVANAHNQTALHTRVEFWTLTGRVADSDAQAAAAIGAEVRGMLDAMEAAIQASDPDAIRDAANKAKRMSGMLSEGVAGKVSAAIDEARKVAREIVKKAEQAGEAAAEVVLECKLEALQSARFAVLDLTGGELAESTPVAGRAVDLEPVAPTEQAAPVAPSIELEAA